MPDTPFPDAPLPPLHNDVHLLHKDNAPAVKWMIGKAMYRCLFLLPLCTSFWLFMLASMLAFHVGLSFWLSISDTRAYCYSFCHPFMFSDIHSF